MTSQPTNCTLTGMSKPSSDSTQCSISTDASPKGPWNGPELTKSPDYILDTLRETKQMINNLQDREKHLKAEVQEMYENGAMAHLVDDKNSAKYNGIGVSVTLVPGRKTRTWDSAVQQEIDQLQQQIKKIEAKAEYARQYQDSQGPSSWRITLQKEL